ncbi:MAG: AAA family ATPase [Pseudonocardia sp.]
MTLVWVTGNSGVGKSTVCTLLRARGELAVDADWDGYSHWEDRTTGQVAADPPYPVPAGWLDRFAWKISRARVEALGVESHEGAVFLCGSIENEAEVRDLFDLMICLVVDDETVRHRLQTRTTNAFGANPEELTAALLWNDGKAAAYRRLGATIVDASHPPEDVVDAVVAAAMESRPGVRDESSCARQRGC